MNVTLLKKSLALATLAAVAACSGGNGGTAALTPTAPQAAATERPSSGSNVLARFVGVGDSLTAGYQAQGFLGKLGAVAMIASPSGSFKVKLPPTQEAGWWANVDEQISGLPVAQAVKREYDPAKSPLPLIADPGLNNQIVNTGVGVAEAKGTNSCTADGGFDAAGYVLDGLQRVRMNPASSLVRDVAVPGITLHEANVLSQPQTDTCEPIPGVPGLLSQVVADESSTFWPVLGGFAKMGSRLSMVRAAASLHPTLAVVWLGANDVLKYMGSGGRFVGGDRTAAQVASDLETTIHTLQYSGARVVVANLPNVLRTPFFENVNVPKPGTCNGEPLQGYAYCVFSIAFGGGRAATKLLAQLGSEYHLSTPRTCKPGSLSAPCGYLTVQGMLEIVQYAASPSTFGEIPNLDCAVPTPKCTPVPGSGLGMNYITPAFAAKVQALNTIVNAGIAQAAASTSSPLVNVEKIFDGIASGNPSDPYYKAARNVKPGVCCTLAYYLPGVTSGGGLVGFDGLHPSNTGYALLANAFIATINKAYGTHVPPIDVTAVYDGTRCPRPYCYPDPYAPPHTN